MPAKKAPLGICDLCGGAIPRSQWYTSKRRERLHCSIDCKNTANSRAGAHIIGRKTRERIAAGEWKNPHLLNPPSPAEQGRRAKLGRDREVAAGVWRNPALSDAARKKLSRPRKHSGVLHHAIEKLRGGKMADLSAEEHAAHKTWRKKLRDQNKPEINRKARGRYQRKQVEMSDDEMDAQRARWRKANKLRPRQSRGQSGLKGGGGGAG